MPPNPRLRRGLDVPVCSECRQRHLTRHNTQACGGHVRYDRESYVPGQDRQLLDEPRPCKQPAIGGSTRCRVHGGGTQNTKIAGQQREQERKAAELLTKLGGAGEPVNDPIAKLCAIAGRAVALMEALAERIDSAETKNREDTRADIVIYGRAIKDASSVVESIIRMGIAERLAKQDGDRTAAMVSFIDGVLGELGHNPRDPEVAAVVVRMLEAAA